jgi:hypothetical protein
VPSTKTLRQIIGEQTAGSWVAISLHHKCVALGISVEEAKLIANAKGEAEVIRLKIPERSVTVTNRSEADHAA